MWGPDQLLHTMQLHLAHVGMGMHLTWWQVATYPFAWERGTVAHRGHSLRGQRGCGWGESTWLSSGLIMNCVWDAVHTRFTSDIQAASRISPSSVLAKSLPQD